MERWFMKQAAAMGSGLPDPSTASASTASIPQPAFENKPPPGQRGPVGMAGRQTFSRVNTGTPPTADAGQSYQKSMAPRGMEFLPKTAQLETTKMTTMMPRPTLQQFIKTAMDASAAKVDVSLEAARQIANSGDVAPGTTKTASAAVGAELDLPPEEYVQKLAAALDYVGDVLTSKTASSPETAADGPGKGPNALPVSNTDPKAGTNIDAGETGHSSQAPTMSPASSALPGQVKDPGTALETDAKKDPMAGGPAVVANEKTTVASINNMLSLGLLKVAEDEHGNCVIVKKDSLEKIALLSAAGQYAGSTAGGAAGGAVGGGLKGAAGGGVTGGVMGGLGGGVLGLLRGGIPGAIRGAVKGGTIGAAGGALLGGTGGAVVGGAKGGIEGAQRAYLGGKAMDQKTASVLARNLMVLGLYKQAEDAINPAQISASKTEDPTKPPEGAAPAEEGVPKEPSDVNSQKSMISSNEAATDYTKRDAKEDPKGDVNDVLDENAQTSATDKVLDKTLENTDEAGAKISSISRQAMARAVLSKLAQQQGVSKKTKVSQGGMAPSTPQAASGFNASSPAGM